MRRAWIVEVRAWFGQRLAVLGMIAIVLAMFNVWLRLQVREVAYELSEVRRLQQRLEHRERELQIQLGTERDSLVLKRHAMVRLGMVEPKRGQVVDIR